MFPSSTETRYKDANQYFCNNQYIILRYYWTSYSLINLTIVHDLTTNNNN